MRVGMAAGAEVHVRAGVRVGAMYPVRAGVRGVPRSGASRNRRECRESVGEPAKWWVLTHVGEPSQSWVPDPRCEPYWARVPCRKGEPSVKAGAEELARAGDRVGTVFRVRA